MGLIMTHVPDGIRLAKVMADRGLCSRREAERLIAAGQVVVDGTVIAEQGVRIRPDAEIRLDQRGQRWMDAKVTVVLHKPVGIVSTQPEDDQVPAWKLLTADRLQGPADPVQVRRICDQPWFLNVAGRLDRDSRGLLLLSSDGVLGRLITGGQKVAKTYAVTCDRPVSPAALTALNGRLELDGERLLPMEVNRRMGGPAALRFVLREGRNRQIRRCCELVGLRVIDLCREAIGGLTLGDLPEGQWRVVSAADRAALSPDAAP
jgi:23S rRNA pseudouridine2604 synthase